VYSWNFRLVCDFRVLREDVERSGGFEGGVSVQGERSVSEDGSVAYGFAGGSV
jgi:hypothetical protein